MALNQFITAFGANYDEDQRIGFIQLGLLGYWGEKKHSNPNTQWLYDTAVVRDEVVQSYHNAFTTTPLQVRTAKDAKRTGANNSGLGGFVWNVWNQTIAQNDTDFWRTNVTGGEGNWHLLYNPSVSLTPFPNAADPNEQNVGLCIDTTHAT